MLEAIGNAVAAFVVASILLSLTDGLFQGGNASLVLGIHNYIVVPEVTAFGGSRVCITGNGGHGQRYEEGVGGRSDHFGNDVFHNQVQTNTQVALNGLAVVIGQIHINSVGVSCHVGFQSILHGSGVLCQRSGHSLIQHIGLIEPAIAVQVVGILITAIAIAQTDCLQQICSFSFVECIQNLSQVVVGVLIVFRLSEGGNGSNVGNGEANALNGIAVTGLAVAQGVIGRTVAVAIANTVAQDVFHIGFSPAGRYKGIFAPNTVLHGIGPVILPEGQRAVCVFVDGGIIHLCCKGSGNTGHDHHQGQTQCKDLLELFHLSIFLSVNRI